MNKTITQNEDLDKKKILFTSSTIKVLSAYSSRPFLIGILVVKLHPEKHENNDMLCDNCLQTLDTIGITQHNCLRKNL